MAGIGFELRRALKADRLFSIVQVFGYSAVLSAGPWVISILAILFIGFLNIVSLQEPGSIGKFQIIITYAIALASSMIVTAFIQLPFTRYVADEIFAGREDELLPAYHGALTLVWGVGFLVMLPVLLYAFPDQGGEFIAGVLSTFLVLSGVWIANILASSLKFYKEVVLAFAISYGAIMVFSYLYGTTLDDLIWIFFAGNALLFAILSTLIAKTYESERLLSYRFFRSRNFYWRLGFAGLFYNLGIWVDKFIFWYHPLTGYEVIGKVHASVVYDLPIFLAYLSILPGMAIFFYRLEADFAEKYDRFYNAVREGGNLKLIDHYHQEMIDVVRHAIREILIVQGIMNIVLFASAPTIFELLHIPMLYLGLLHVLTVGAQLQLGLLAILALLFYLDRRNEAMGLSILFFVLNGLLSYLSIGMGPEYFGYGYAVSLLIVFTISLFVIRKELRELEYETFMLR